MGRLAFKSMLGDRSKLLIALLGVAFSVVLVNIQAGLFLGLIQMASLLVDCGQADIWVGHRHMNNVDMGGFVPERWVQRLRKIDGVERVDPYIVMFGQAKMPSGKFENVLIVGSDAGSLLGGPWALAEGDPKAIVTSPDAISIDVCDEDRLGNCKVGDVREINGYRAKVVARTHGIVGFTTNPYVFTTIHRARRYCAIPADKCSYFLIKARPGADHDALCARIRAQVPELLDVRDRTTWSWMCMEYWMTRSGIGISFGLATFLGLLVGLAVVAQTLYASITERLKEFGTLKALGADDRCVCRFLLAQALVIAAMGSVLGLAVAVLIGLTATTPRAPIVLDGYVMAASVAMILGVCLTAACLPYWRVRRIDPASVLRS